MEPLPQALFDLASPYIGNTSAPPDRALAEALASYCRRVNFDCSEVEIHRRVGWSFVVTAQGHRFEVQFARYRRSSTLLAVLPLSLPGSSQAARSELRRLCAVLHTHLSQVSGARDLLWMLGGPPGAVPMIDSPQRLARPDGEA